MHKTLKFRNYEEDVKITENGSELEKYFGNVTEDT